MPVAGDGTFNRMQSGAPQPLSTDIEQTPGEHPENEGTVGGDVGSQPSPDEGLAAKPHVPSIPSVPKPGEAEPPEHVAPQLKDSPTGTRPPTIQRQASGKPPAREFTAEKAATKSSGSQKFPTPDTGLTEVPPDPPLISELEPGETVLPEQDAPVLKDSSTGTVIPTVQRQASGKPPAGEPTAEKAATKGSGSQKFHTPDAGLTEVHPDPPLISELEPGETVLPEQDAPVLKDSPTGTVTPTVQRPASGKPPAGEPTAGKAATKGSDSFQSPPSDNEPAVFPKVPGFISPHQPVETGSPPDLQRSESTVPASGVNDRSDVPFIRPESADIAGSARGILPTTPSSAPLIDNYGQEATQLPPTARLIPPQALNAAQPPEFAGKVKGRFPIDSIQDETGIELPRIRMITPPGRSSEALGPFPPERQAAWNGTKPVPRGAGLASTLPSPVQITIDRIEVQAPPTFEPPPLPNPPVNLGPALSLEDYLQQRDKGST